MRRIAAIAFIGMLVSACQSGEGPESPIPADITGLEGTSWTLVEFQSSDDATGTVRPDDPQKYTMTLAADGRVSMKLNCNSGSGTWKAGSAGGNSGSFEFGPLATTKMLCPPPSLDQQIARDTAYVRSYVLEGERLYLSLMADGGIYVWQKTS